MSPLTRAFLTAIAVLIVGMVVFFAYLSWVCGECDKHTYSLLDYVVAGALMGPGFGLVIRWARARNEARAGKPS